MDRNQFADHRWQIQIILHQAQMHHFYWSRLNHLTILEIAVYWISLYTFPAAKSKRVYSNSIIPHLIFDCFSNFSFASKVTPNYICLYNPLLLWKTQRLSLFHQFEGKNHKTQKPSWKKMSPNQSAFHFYLQLNTKWIQILAKTIISMERYTVSILFPGSSLHCVN